VYYLHPDQTLQAQRLSLPRSTRTIWRILRKFGCILDAPGRHHRPQDRPDPMEEIQFDFKNATSVPPDPDGKQQHVLEVLNFVDAGTSTWLQAKARTDFHTETALEAVARFLTRYGCPRRMTFDRHSRSVGSSSLRHFPSAFCRFLLCLGIHPNICPPRRPDKNAYVERLHRTLTQECLQIRLPTTLGTRGDRGVPLKGLVGQQMAWEQYVAFIKEQAGSPERCLLDKQHRMRQLSLGINAPDGDIQMRSDEMAPGLSP
jgi:hypothetical protein